MKVAAAWALAVASATNAPTAEDGHAAIPVNVHWDAPAECPDADALRLRVEAILGRALSFDPDADALIDGRVTHDEAGYTLELVTQVEGRREVRTLQAEGLVPGCSRSRGE